MLSDPVPLKILLCDHNADHAKTLLRHLEVDSRVIRSSAVNSISAAQSALRSEDFNSIFIDPLGFKLAAASDFIFSIRKALPEIVFVLYVDFDEVESRRSDFFRAERARFNHYYKLDKRTSVSNLARELDAVLGLCQLDLSWRLSSASLAKLRSEVANLEKLSKSAQTRSTTDKIEVTKTIIEKLETVLDQLPRQQQTDVVPRSVFVSYRFEESEYFDGIKSMLTKRGLQVITGERADSSISAAIIERIKKAQCFLSLMTRHKRKEDGNYTTSSWLIEEKGAALALGKRIILMVEEGVDEIGGLQGDWQRIHFGPKGFINAALAAVEQAASYAGIGSL